MSKTLIIVESPAKSKTLQKFLGDNFIIRASVGHVRDLPGNTLAVDIKNNYTPSYSVIKDKKKFIKEINSLSKKVDTVLIATDPDREGEAIAWHIQESITVPKEKIKRISFYEITNEAVKKAMSECRSINIDLVDAQQARRILDRLIGYKLSPVLSKKIMRGLSAGRVQSVTLRLICEREVIIQAFVPEEFWILSADIKNTSTNTTFEAKLFAQGTEDKKCEIKSKEEADAILSDLDKASLSISDIKKKTQHRHPNPPFITSTLQQDGSRKFNWSTKRTMLIAQQLYEGITIDNDSIGLITYMRTDSTRLSKEATDAAKKQILKDYGENYLSTKASKQKKTQHMQDAHEAIRPTYIEHTPESLSNKLSPEHLKLYRLIYNRFLASQMTSAKIETNTVIISGAKEGISPYLFRISSQKVLFDGFTKIYQQDSESDEDQAPTKSFNIEKDHQLTLQSLTPTQKFTTPPKHYTEASIVKEMEENGIGRPSTYSPTLSTLLDRNYVIKNGRSLVPEKLGMVVNEQLTKFFSEVINVQFTADLEKKLDEITVGKHDWHQVVDEIYNPFSKLITHANDNMDKVKYGERLLGTDPETKKNVYVKIGRYGPLIQIGESSLDGKTEEKPRFASLLPSQSIETITLEEALEQFSFPRTIGTFEDKPVDIGIGRYGPFARHNNKFYSLKKEQDPTSISLDDALLLIEEKREADKNKYIKVFEDHDPRIEILRGRYGPYISIGKKNIRIPKSMTPESLTLEDCLKLEKEAKTYKRKKR